MYPTIEDIERVIQQGIKNNDFYAYILSAIDRRVDETAKGIAYVSLNAKKASWTLVVNPVNFDNMLKQANINQKIQKETLLYAILLHEFFHLARDHFERSKELKGFYSMKTVNIAADLAINCTLPFYLQDILRKAGGLFPNQFGFDNGLSLEQYLENILKKKDKNGDIEYAENGLEEEQRRAKKEGREAKISKINIDGPQQFEDVSITIDELEEFEKAADEKKAKGNKPNNTGQNEEKSNDDQESNQEVQASTKAYPNLATSKLKNDLKKLIENLKKFGLDIENSRDRNAGIGSGGFGWLIDWIFKEAKIPWKKLLKNSLLGNTRSREWYRSFRRTHPRSDSGILLKGKYPFKQEKVLVLLDTSGSMGQEDYQQFFGVLNSLKKDGIEAFVSQWDYGKLHMEPTPLVSYMQHDYAQITGGGGTDMAAGVTYVYEHYPDFQRIIVVTDGGTPYFTEDNPSPIPVIWLITEDYMKFENADGKVIYLKK